MKIIEFNGCILMNRCRRENGEAAYDLPGGGRVPLGKVDELESVNPAGVKKLLKH